MCTCVSSSLSQPVAWLCENMLILCLWVDRYKSSAAERKLCYSWEKHCLSRGIKAKGLSAFLFFIFSHACSHLNMRTQTHINGFFSDFNWIVFGWKNGKHFEIVFEGENCVSVYHHDKTLTVSYSFSRCPHICLLACVQMFVRCNRILEVLVETCAIELKQGGCQYSWSMRCLWKHWWAH